MFLKIIYLYGSIHLKDKITVLFIKSIYLMANFILFLDCVFSKYFKKKIDVLIKLLI